MIFFYISLVTYFCFSILKYRQSLIILDNSKYNLKNYLKGIKKNYKELFLTPELLALILIVIAINTDAKITGICFVIFYTLMFLYFLKHKKGKFALKKNQISLIVIILLIIIGVNVSFYCHYLIFEDDFLLFYTTWIYYIVSILISYFAFLIVLVAEVINKPIELILNKKHKLKKNKKSNKVGRQHKS